MVATQFLIKVALAALVVGGVAELARRSTFIGAVLASLPLTSMLALVWLYVETHDTDRIATLSTSIFWLVLPSLVLFVVLPLLLRAGWGFWYALGTASVATAVAYLSMVKVLAALGTQL